MPGVRPGCGIVCVELPPGQRTQAAGIADHNPIDRNRNAVEVLRAGVLRLSTVRHGRKIVISIGVGDRIPSACRSAS